MNEIKSLDRYYHVFTKKPKHFRELRKQLSIDEETMGIVITGLLLIQKIKEVAPNTYTVSDYRYKPII